MNHTMGTMQATMFFQWESLRKEGNGCLHELILFCAEYNVNFRHPGLCAFLCMELSSFRYYPCIKFQALCALCFDFTTLTNPKPKTRAARGMGDPAIKIPTVDKRWGHK